MSFVTIRSMQPYDLDDVFKIEQLTQTHPWSKQQFLDSLSSYQCTVVDLNHQVIGFCILQPVLDEANLLLMAIHPDYQGQGHGFYLLDNSLKKLKNSPIQIFLEVRESNSAAIRLYEKQGFHQIDLRKNYYPASNDQREHAIIMVKSCTDDFAALFK